MNRIIYAYIKSFQMLKNIGFSFSGDYSFQMKGHCLEIKRAELLPKNFWGTAIYSLSAIVGNNGSGKSTALRFLMKALVEGESIEGLNGFLIYESESPNKVLSVCYLGKTSEDDVKCIYNGLEKTTCLNSVNKQSMHTMFYSGHFSPDYIWRDPASKEMAGCYNASDGCRIVMDLQKYSNIDTLHCDNSLNNHLLAFHAQNHYRICNLLLFFNIEVLLGGDFQFPKYIIFDANSSGKLHYTKVKNEKELKRIPKEHQYDFDRKERFIAHLIYENIFNWIDEQSYNEIDLFTVLNTWQSVLASKKNDQKINVLEEFLSVVQNSSVDITTKSLLKQSYIVLSRLCEICSYESENHVFYYPISNGKEKLKELMELISGIDFLTAKYFDIYYSHTKDISTRLSSGEQEILNLLSRVYDAVEMQPKKINSIEKPTLLLLDEAEIGFHPEWQRRYINIIVEFLSELYKITQKSFQVVITTHSPIILSDIPSCCVIFLKRDVGVTINDVSQPETFGQNVFNLYRRSFFMENGLIGEFSASKIKEIERKLIKDNSLSSQDIQKIKTEIDLIGDERIKAYLIDLLSKKDRNSAIEYYKQKIEELEHEEFTNEKN